GGLQPAAAGSAQQVGHAGALLLELGQGPVHGGTAEVIDFQALDAGVFAVFGDHRDAVDHALGDAVAAVGRHAHGHPLAVRAQHPVADVVDGGIGGRGGRGQAAGLDDRRAALADLGDELVRVPVGIIDAILQRLALDGGEAVVGIHGRTVVAPDHQLLDVAHGHAGLVGELAQRAVVVQAQHGGEV